MATKTESVERTIDQEIDTDLSDDEALATLSDRQENRVQMQEIKRRTVAPNLMKLSVSQVTSAENSQNWAIDIDHPAMDDDIRVFVEKPMHGWTRDYKIVRVLDWYGVHDQDPHKLEFHDVYLKKDEEQSDYAHGWLLVEPPEYKYEAPMRVQIGRTTEWLLTMRPNRTNVLMWLILGLGVVGGTAAGTLVGPIIPIPVVTLIAFVSATILGMAMLDNGGDD